MHFATITITSTARRLRGRVADSSDAYDDAPTLVRLLGGGRTTKVLTTHQHWDHHRALKDVTAATAAVTVAGEPDADAITEQTTGVIDDRVVDGDTVEFGDVRLQVIHIVGHTPGSLTFLYDDPDGTPHHWPVTASSPAGWATPSATPTRFASLINDVETKLFGTLPDETWF